MHDMCFESVCYSAWHMCYNVDSSVEGFGHFYCVSSCSSSLQPPIAVIPLCSVHPTPLNTFMWKMMPLWTLSRGSKCFPKQCTKLQIHEIQCPHATWCPTWHTHIQVDVCQHNYGKCNPTKRIVHVSKNEPHVRISTLYVISMSGPRDTPRQQGSACKSGRCGTARS